MRTSLLNIEKLSATIDGEVLFNNIDLNLDKGDKILVDLGSSVGDVTEVELIVKKGKTFFWSGKYHNDMNTRDTLVTELNTLADFNPVVPTNYRDSGVVMLGNLHPIVQSSVLNQMTVKPKLVILDTMNFWMNSALSDLHDVIKRRLAIMI